MGRTRPSLHGRDWSHLAPFERELILERPHTGWVEYSGPGRFRLRKSPFLKEYSEYVYIMPDGAAPPPENAFVTVEGREFRRARFRVIPSGKGNRVEGSYERTMEVEAWKEDVLDPPLPVEAAAEAAFGTEVGFETDGTLAMHDFLYRLAAGWNDATADGLDLALGMQYVSCPVSAYGQGGLGVQVYSTGAGTGAVNHYGRYMRRMLHREFCTGHPNYVYVPVSDVRGVRTVDRLESRTEEVNYSYLRWMPPEETRRPVQIPVLLETATPRRGVTEPSPDIISYQLTALMIRPVLDDATLQEFERNIMETERLIIRNEDRSGGVDLGSVNRIAESLARLRLRNDLDEDRFAEASRTFLRFYREYLESRDVLSRFRGGATYDRPQVRVSYLHSRLRRPELQLLKELVRQSEERGLDWIPTGDLRAALGADDLWPAIKNLQNYGYIIHRENYGYLRAVLLDEMISGLE